MSSEVDHSAVVVPLPVDQWPELDRQLWARAQQPGLKLSQPGRASAWRPDSRRLAELGYADWLGWLAEAGLLEPDRRPAARVTEQMVIAFAERLRGRLAGVTVSIRLRGLHRALRAMEGCTTLRWIDGLTRFYERASPPARNKAARVVPSADLFALGLQLMETGLSPRCARVHGALQYRNGLLIAFLAAHPIRRRNLGELELGKTFFRQDTCYRFRFEGTSTKSHRAIEHRVMPELTEAFDRYLEAIRPMLLGRGKQPDRPMLWIGIGGEPLDAGTILRITSTLTSRHLGRAVSPHLFRDCAATSVAIEDADHIGMAHKVLAHTSQATTQKHYILASTLSASRRHVGSVLSLREQLSE